MELGTLIFPISGNSVYLSKKKVGFGAGYLNGYGGKVNKGENIEQAALRELQEESGVIASTRDLNKVAVINFFEAAKPIFECHVFFVKDWTGDFIETDEMSKPASYDLESIPFDEMWKGDREWLPLVFAGKKIKANVFYKAGMKGLEKFEFSPF